MATKPVEISLMPKPPGWVIVLAGRLIAGIASGELGRPSVANLILNEFERQQNENVRKIYISGDEENFDAIYVEWRGRRYGKGPVLWAITHRFACLNKAGEWEYEPQPSSRDDAFLARCRWTSLEKALIEADKKKGATA